MGMLVSALFLGSSVLLAFRVPPLLFMRPGWLGIERLSLLGVLGYVVSMLVGLRLVRAINRSGHLDHVDVD
jgi:ubiquinone biosynthesis protein